MSTKNIDKDMIERGIKVYSINMHLLYKYVGFTDNQIMNFLDSILIKGKNETMENLHNELDEFNAVKFIYENSCVAKIYTMCHNRSVAIERLKEVMLPLSEAYNEYKPNTKWNKDLFLDILERNTKPDAKISIMLKQD